MEEEEGARNPSRGMARAAGETVRGAEQRPGPGEGRSWRCHGCRVALAAEAGAGRLRESWGGGSRAAVFARGILGGLGQG